MTTVTITEDGDQVKLARSLVDPDDQARKGSIEAVAAFLKAAKELTSMQMLKLWKGLYYSLWIADKTNVQLQLAENISKFIHIFQDKSLVLLFIRSFLETILREWSVLDKYRVEKFYSFIRYFVRETFVLLKKSGWNDEYIKDVLDIYVSYVFTRLPNGPRFHIADIYLQELSRVSEGKIKSNKFFLCIRPFLDILKSGREYMFFERVFSAVFQKYLTDYSKEAFERKQQEAAEAEAEDEAEGEEKKPEESEKCFEYVTTTSLQKAIFDIASAEDIWPSNRKKAYSLHREYAAVTKIDFVSDDAMEVEEPTETTNTKGKKARKASEVEEPVVTSTTSKKAKKTDVESNVVAEPVSTKKGKKSEAESTPAAPPVSAKKEKKVEAEPVKAPVESAPVSAKKPNKSESEVVSAPAKTPKKAEPEETKAPVSTRKAKQQQQEEPVEPVAPVSTKKSKKSEEKVEVPETKNSTATPKGKAAEPTAAAEPIAENAPFIASKKFTGSKPGYVFTTGAQGLGYYVDKKPVASAKTVKKAAAPTKGRK